MNDDPDLDEADHEPLPRIRPPRDRRQFFSRGANAVGWAALASLLGRDGLRAPAPGLDASIAAGQDALRRPRRSTSSTCTWSAGRRRWTCTTTSRR